MLKLVKYYDILYLRNARKYREQRNSSNKRGFIPISNQEDCLFSTEKAGIVMCKASEVGKIVVNKCIERQIYINTQKLQKLLVLMQIECIRRSQRPLFKEDIRVWDCGVAIKEVDDAFCQYAERFTHKLEEFISLLDAEERSVNYVLKKYGGMSVYELSDLPDIRKVIDLGVIGENNITPHVSYQILMGVFCQ